MAAPETSGVAQRPTVQVPEVINPTEGCGRVPVSRSQSSSTDQVGDWYRLFFNIQVDEYLTRKLHNSLQHMVVEEDELESISTNLPERHSHRVRRKRKRTGKEFRLDVQVAGYDIKDVMLDLGSDVNILPNNSWEAMGQPKLLYSLIQMCGWPTSLGSFPLVD
uniref:Uncharacterized protein n=1 Tax=Picea glauca TaxID=3330 RepID=A0A117NI68_PICGL|nr:hypothetical protein ABT39_MTgene3981 [Picea glauca]